MNNNEMIKRIEYALDDNDTQLLDRIKEVLNDDPLDPAAYGSVEILRQKYRTVVTGSQEWMAENLYFPELGCYYHNDEATSYFGYGTLHNVYSLPAVKALLPKGWRIPDEYDWTNLTDFIESSVPDMDVAKALKSRNDWIDGLNGTDDVGFNAKPAGRKDVLDFSGRGFLAAFWVMTANIEQSSFILLDRNKPVAYHTPALVNQGYGSIRCVRDVVVGEE